MVIKKKKDKALEKLGLKSSIVLFLVSWIGFLSTTFLFILEIFKVVANTTAKGLFFLPFYFALWIVYGLFTLTFAGRINRIHKSKKKIKKKKK